MRLRAFFLLLVILPTYSLFAGGGQEKSGDLVSLKVMIIQTPVPKSEGTVDDNPWTRIIKDEVAKIGLNVKFVPIGGSMVSHTIMMATGSAPDLAMTHGRLLFLKFAADGGLHDLGPIVSSLGPNIVSTLGEEHLQYGRVDGKLYAVPSRKADQARYASFIRKDWLDALSLDAPKNRDELEVVLRAFKQMNPETSGVSRVIPWGYFADDPGTVFDSDFALFDVMYSFLEHDEAENMRSVWPEREGFREFLSWVHRLYQDGLIEPEFATDTSEIKNREIVNGEVGFYHAHWRHPFGQTVNSISVNLAENQPGAEYIPIDVFQNSAGEYRKMSYLPLRYYVFSPVKSKKPEEVVKYLNWLLDEEVAWRLTFGNEGEHHTVRDGMPVLGDLDHFRQTFSYISHRLRVLGDYPFPEPIVRSFEEQLRIHDFQGRDYLAQELSRSGSFYEPVFSERMPDMSRYGPGLIKICEKYWVKLITEPDFDANYAEFIEKLYSRNLAQISAERTAYYERNK